MKTQPIDAEYFCGIDLHANFLYATVVDHEGNSLMQRKIKNDFADFHQCIQPFLPDLAVGTESTYNWYWLGDRCKKYNIDFYLGHAYYIKLIAGGKKKTDKLDSETLANLMRTGYFPKAYAYPEEMRTVRDLLRRRSYYVALRAAAYTHIQATFSQHANQDISGQDVKGKFSRLELPNLIENLNSKFSVEIDLDFITALDQIIKKLEKQIRVMAVQHDPQALTILKSITGIGDILSQTILYEIHTVDRFPSAKKFSSYCRVVKCERTSAGKKTGNGNQKIGNPYLKWAFDQIINTAKQKSPAINKRFERLVAKHGKPKARAIMGHKYAVAVYYMLKNKQSFDEDIFLR